MVSTVSTASIEVREQFARAVAGDQDSIRVYPTDENTTEEQPWTRVPARPYAVHLNDSRGCVRCISMDFDSKLGDATAEADTVSELLGSVDIKHLVCRSGPSDGRHVFVSLAERFAGAGVLKILTDLKSELHLFTLDLRPNSSSRTAAIRPPLAPHRNGGHSEILNQSADEALAIFADGGATRDDLERLYRELSDGCDRSDIEELRKALMPTKRKLTDQELSDRGVSALTLAFLNGTQLPKGDSSNSGILWACMMGLMHKVTPEEAFLAVEHVLEQGITNKPSRGTTQEYFELEWARASAKYEPAFQGRSDAIAEIQSIAVRALETNELWHGRSGKTDRAVYEAIVKICVKAGKLSVDPGVRALALASMVTRTTANTATQRLQAKGLVCITPAPHKDDASTIKLIKHGNDDTYTSLHGGRVLGVSVTVLSEEPHEAFKGQPSTRLVYQALSNSGEALTVKDLSEVSGAATQTVRDAIKRLLFCELIEDTTPERTRNKQYKAISEADLDQVAQEVTFTAGTRQKAKDRHEKERHEYRSRVGFPQRKRARKNGQMATVITLGPGREVDTETGEISDVA